MACAWFSMSIIKARQESSVIPSQPDAAKPAGGFTRAVAIGVGPGGLAELTALFGALTQGSDLAFIVVQHGSPSAPDALTDLISGLTDLKVHRLQYGAQLCANEVRVAPPGYAVDLHGSRLQLELLPEPSERRTVVDRLFRSLARSLGSRAVGVVLPGTGADGTLGARALAREGGAVFAARGGSEIEVANVAPSAVSNMASGFADAPGRTPAQDPNAPDLFSPGEIAHLLREPSALSQYAASLPKTRAAGSSQMARLAAEKLALQERIDELQRSHAELEQRTRVAEQKLATAQARDTAWRNTQIQQEKMLRAAAIGQITLDAQLRVESFRGDLSGIYPLSKADIGQPLAARAHRAHEMPALPALDSLRPGTIEETQVVTAGRWFLRRVVPRHDAAGRIAVGMTVVFIDVTQLKRAGGGASSHVVSCIDGAASRTQPPR